MGIGKSMEVPASELVAIEGRNEKVFKSIAAAKPAATVPSGTGKMDGLIRP